MGEFLGGENQISIYRAESTTLHLKIIIKNTNPLDRCPEKAQDLTDCKIFFTVKANTKDQQFLIQKTSDSLSQIEITEPRAGKADIFISSEDTQFLDPMEYSYDIWVVLSDGKRKRVIGPSIFEILDTVTKFS